MTPLERAILRAITWFDLLSYPLTTFECWQYLNTEGEVLGNVSPQDVRVALSRLRERGVVSSSLGFWQLANTSDRLAKRQARARTSVFKRKRAARAAKFLRFVPWVRMVGLCNTTALEAARPESDIDLFIVVKPGRLFLARLFVTTLLQLRGWRRHGTKVKNRLCLSFYVTTSHLNLQPLAYADDPYLTYWVASLAPLCGPATYREFLQANSWVGEVLPNWLGGEGASSVARLRLPVAGTTSLLQKWFELLVTVLGAPLWERLARRFELWRIASHRESRLGDGTTAVVASNHVLKFHENDQRPALAQAFRQALQILLSEA